MKSIISLLQGEMSNFSYLVPAGGILNRFSKDIGQMDDSLPLMFQVFMQVMLRILSNFHREEQSACWGRGWAFQPGDVFCYLQ